MLPPSSPLMGSSLVTNIPGLGISRRHFPQAETHRCLYSEQHILADGFRQARHDPIFHLDRAR